MAFNRLWCWRLPKIQLGNSLLKDFELSDRKPTPFRAACPSKLRRWTQRYHDTASVPQVGQLQHAQAWQHGRIAHENALGSRADRELRSACSQVESELLHISLTTEYNYETRSTTHTTSHEWAVMASRNDCGSKTSPSERVKANLGRRPGNQPHSDFSHRAKLGLPVATRLSCGPPPSFKQTPQHAAQISPAWPMLILSFCK